MSLRYFRLQACLALVLPFLLGPSSSHAGEAAPDWRPADICANDSARGQCLLFEVRAQNDVTASWGVLPEAVRTSCLTRFQPPLEPSWRILADCIEIEGRLAQEAKSAALREREETALEALRAQKVAARDKSADEAKEAKETEDARRRRLAAETSAERKRIEDEEASFMALLAAQQKAAAEAAERKAAAKKAIDAQRAADDAARAAKRAAEARRRKETERAAEKLALETAERQRVAEEAMNSAAEAERRRVAEEEASFMAMLAEQRKADAKAKRLAEEKKQRAAAKAAEAERRRVAEEEASFMVMLAEQRKADAKAKRLAEEKKQRAAAKAAEAERRRVAEEEASFMAMLAEQRKADAEAKQEALAAQQRSSAAARQTAATTCQAKLKQIKSSGSIRFGYNSAALADKDGISLLDRLAQAVSDCEGELSVVVEGHTDSNGTKSGNATLSKARAQAVAAYLIDKGVAANRISAVGLGAAKPIATNDTRDGRARNRRIEFVVK